MEMEWKKMTNRVEAKFDGMELKGNGNGVEKWEKNNFVKWIWK